MTTNKTFRSLAALLVLLGFSSRLSATDTLFIWPDLAPRETKRSTGETQPPRKGEDPPITRLVNVRRPSMDVYLPAKSAQPTPAVVVLPGGGYGKVVPDKEGNEAAPWLNPLGVAVFVLKYRTNEETPKTEPAWLRPLQDSQRAIRLVRANAAQWNIDPKRVGLLAFSAGGHIGAVHHTRKTRADYPPRDAIDKQPSRPDFSLLIYPWRVLNDATGDLHPYIQPAADSPPAFIVHTSDDRSSSVGSVLIYAGLRKHNVPAELHVYTNGGHGYGMRPVNGSVIGTWPERATDWLRLHGLTSE
jgi:acetyl esterase/lipase